MFGNSKFKKKCESKRDPTSLAGALAKIALITGSKMLADRNLWAGGSRKNTDAAIFEASALVHFQICRAFSSPFFIDQIAEANNINQDEIEEVARAALDEAAEVMIAVYVLNAGGVRTEVRQHLASRVKPYMVATDALSEFATQLRKLSNQPSRPDLMADVKAIASFRVFQSTVLPTAIGLARDVVVAELQGNNPW